MAEKDGKVPAGDVGAGLSKRKEDEKDDDDDEEEENHNTILNMSLIRSILGAASSASSQKDDGSRSTARNNKSVSFTGLDSGASSLADDMDHGALIEKIGRLDGKYREAKQNLFAEKTLRKKKEKNLIKLAKELNKRATEHSEKMEEIARLKAAIAEMATKLVDSKKKLDESKANHDAKVRSHYEALNDADRKYRTAVLEHDARISELNKTHDAECKDLRRQLRESNEEVNRAQAQIKTANQEVHQAQAQIKVANKETSRLQLQVNAKHEETNRLQAKMKAKDEEASHLQKQVNAKHEETNRLQLQVKTKHDETNRLEAQIKAKHEETNRLQAQVNAKNNETTRLQAQMKSKNDETNRLQAQMKAKNEETKHLQAQVKAGSDETNRLRAQVRAAHNAMNRTSSLQPNTESEENEPNVVGTESSIPTGVVIGESILHDKTAPTRQPIAQPIATVSVDDLRAVLKPCVRASLKEIMPRRWVLWGLFRSFVGWVVFLVACLVAILAAVMMHLQLTSLDRICSPIRPGTTLTPAHADTTMNAPWWLPDDALPTLSRLLVEDLKVLDDGNVVNERFEEAWAWVCAERPRCSATWSGGTLTVSLLSDSKTLLEKSKQLAVEVRPESLVVFTHWGKMDVQKAPWSG